MPKHNVEIGRKFTGSRSGNRLEVNIQRSPHLRVADALVNEVPAVARVSLYITLGRELLSSLALDAHVYVRSRSTRISFRLNRAEVVFTLGTGKKTTITLKILVKLVPIATSRM